MTPKAAKEHLVWNRLGESFEDNMLDTEETSHVIQQADGTDLLLSSQHLNPPI